MTRKSFSGAAVATTLNGGINSSVLSMTVQGISNWPDTSIGPFVVTVDRGQATEEKMLCSSFSLNVVNIEERGYDGTTAQPHNNGATVECTLDANTIDTHDAYTAGNGTVPPTNSAVGDVAANGTSAVAAAADHKHGREPFTVGVTTPSAPGDIEADGTSVSPARADHKHARETGATLGYVTHVFSASGDLLLGTGTGTGELLGIGAAKTVLTSNGTQASWAVLPLPVGNVVATSEVTTSTSYTDLNTVGPAVTVTTGTTAVVTVTAEMGETSPSQALFMGFAVSGATTVAASDAQAIRGTGNEELTISGTFWVTGLTAGSNTFTAKYRVSGFSGSFLNRNIIVTPLP